jgi:hypothetical protein
MPNDSILAYVLGQLGAWKGRWRTVAKGSKVSYRTLEKIARGESKNPKILTLEKLAAYFRKQKQKEDAA